MTLLIKRPFLKAELALAMMAAFSQVRCAAQVPQDTKPMPKIGVFTFSGGFKHSSLEVAEKTIAEIGRRSGAFEAVLHHQYRQEPDKLDLGMLNADYLKQFAGIVFYTTSGPKDLDLLTERQRADLMNAIKGGTAFVGVHSATDTFYNWPEFGEMIGGYFDGHPWGADHPAVTIKIEDPSHPASVEVVKSLARGGAAGQKAPARGAQRPADGAQRPSAAARESKPEASTASGLPRWVIQDEIYQFKAPYDRSKLHVIMSLDASATDMNLPGIVRTDGDFAIAWAKHHGKGRVFYTALGHREDVWANPLFQQHLLGGIQWALRQVDGQPADPRK